MLPLQAAQLQAQLSGTARESHRLHQRAAELERELLEARSSAQQEAGRQLADLTAQLEEARAVAAQVRRETVARPANSPQRTACFCFMLPSFRVPLLAQPSPLSHPRPAAH